MFRVIEVKKKSVYAAEQIIRAIKSGMYKVGDRLPPERVLAEKMGISRPLVREALSALEIAGIVESKPGAGTYVRKAVTETALEYQVLSMLEEEGDPVEALEARAALEEGVARLAAEKASKEDIHELKGTIEQGELALADGNLESFEEADLNFHLTLIRICRNPSLEATLRPLLRVMKTRLWKGMKKRYIAHPQLKVTLQEHRQILQALAVRDGELAAKAMREHLENSKARLLEGEEGR